jgi:hypothetical protein
MPEASSMFERLPYARQVLDEVPDKERDPSRLGV